MARRVFVHIGLPKAGSTFLQTTMWQNRGLLRARGFLYPGAKRMDHYHASQAVRGASRRRPRASTPDAWDRLREELNALGRRRPAQPRVPQHGHRRSRRADLVASLDGRGPRRRGPARLRPPVPGGVAGSAEDELRPLRRRLHGRRCWPAQVPGRLGLALPGRPAGAGASGAGPCRAERLHVITVPPPGAPRHLLWDRWTRGARARHRRLRHGDRATPTSRSGAPQAALLQRVKPHLTGPLTKGPERHRWVRAYFAHEVLVPQRGAAPRAARGPPARPGRGLVSGPSTAVREGGYPVAGDLTTSSPSDEPGLARPGRGHATPSSSRWPRSRSSA